MDSFEREARRARIRLNTQHLADDVDREQHVAGVMAMCDGPPYGRHHGYYRDHKHPHDKAAELEEAWLFANAKPRSSHARPLDDVGGRA